MAELLFLKLGGSLLTDKTRPETLRTGVLARLAAEIAAGWQECPELRLLIGHGSGSFGHVAASKYGTRAGVVGEDGWRGYAETAVAAARLNRLVVEALAAAGLPVLPVQPSASARCRNGELVELDIRPINMALANRLVPVVFGDVALDEVRGGTIISTEEIFAWLAERLHPQRVVLVGEVPGVLSAPPPTGVAPCDGDHGEAVLLRPDYRSTLIPEITTADLPALAESATLGGSGGIDVTGGMLAKVQEMAALVERMSSLDVVHLVGGCEAGVVHGVLVDPKAAVGTRIRRAA